MTTFTIHFISSALLASLMIDPHLYTTTEVFQDKHLTSDPSHGTSELQRSLYWDNLFVSFEGIAQTHGCNTRGGQVKVGVWSTMVNSDYTHLCTQVKLHNPFIACDRWDTCPDYL